MNKLAKKLGAEAKKGVDWVKARAGEIKICTDCKSKKSYTNPFATCFECKKRFCFDCINGIQVNDKMGDNEEARDICDECRNKFDYKTL